MLTTLTDHQFVDAEMTLWDKLVVKEGDITLQAFLDLFKDRYEVDVDMVGMNNALLYSSFIGSAATRKERLATKHVSCH